MDLKEKIKSYISRKCDSAKILNLLTVKKYVTCSDIINFECAGTELIFTSCPHKIIETLRKELGYDVIKDEDVTYEKVMYREGKPFKAKKHYKRYYLNLEGV